MSDSIILGSTNANGTLSVRGKDGQPLVELLGRDNEAVIAAGQTGRAGRVTLYNGAQQQTAALTSADARLLLGGGGVNGTVSVSGKDGIPLVELLGRDNEAVIAAGQTGRAGRVTLYNGAQQQTAALTSADARLLLGGGGVNGTVSVSGKDGIPLVELLGRDNEAVIGVGQTGHPGRITLYDGAGNGAIELSGSAGDITLFNADCAEEFDIAEPEGVDAGTVVVIDDEGRLLAANTPYDNRVAGVVSGAGQFKPALVLDRRDTGLERVPVALLGKVYCKVDAGHGVVRPGDLLTTSSTKGYAMRVGDLAQAQGTVIGKAIAGLRSGVGLIPMLVMLR